MAESYAVDSCSLSLDAGVSACRDLRSDQPDQAGCCISAKQHRRGQGRLNPGEFRQFLGIARGSNCEVMTQLEIARALQFAKPELLEEAERLSHEVGKMIHSFQESLKDQIIERREL
jgi:four helix bundle protein